MVAAFLHQVADSTGAFGGWGTRIRTWTGGCQSQQFQKVGRLTEASTDRRSHELTDCVSGHHIIGGGPGRGI